jgi:hypothetical protein
VCRECGLYRGRAFFERAIMQINTKRDGSAKIRLTKQERKALADARLILRAISRIEDGPESDGLCMASKEIGDVLDRYNEPEKAE